MATTWPGGESQASLAWPAPQGRPPQALCSGAARGRSQTAPSRLRAGSLAGPGGARAAALGPGGRPGLRRGRGGRRSGDPGPGAM